MALSADEFYVGVADTVAGDSLQRFEKSTRENRVAGYSPIGLEQVKLRWRDRRAQEAPHRSVVLDQQHEGAHSAGPLSSSRGGSPIIGSVIWKRAPPVPPLVAVASPPCRARDPADDGETQASACGARYRASHELVEERIRRLCETRTGVGHLERERGARLPRRDVDPCLRRGVGNRVLEHVHQRLLDQQRIDRRKWQGLRHVRGELAAAQTIFHPRDRRPHDLVDGDPLTLHLDGAGIELGHREQVHHHALEPARLVTHGIEELVAGFGAEVSPIAQDAPGAGDRRERRTQVA